MADKMRIRSSMALLEVVGQPRLYLGKSRLLGLAIIILPLAWLLYCTLPYMYPDLFFQDPSLFQDDAGLLRVYVARLLAFLLAFCLLVGVVVRPFLWKRTGQFVRTVLYGYYPYLARIVLFAWAGLSSAEVPVPFRPAGLFFFAPIIGGILQGLLGTPWRATLGSSLVVGFSVALVVEIGGSPLDPVFGSLFLSLAGYFFLLLVGGIVVGRAVRVVHSRRMGRGATRLCDLSRMVHLDVCRCTDSGVGDPP